MSKFVETTALAVAETKVFNEDVTLRAIFEGGAINSFGGYDTRVTDRYFGNGKIRGFDTNGIGPRDTGAPATLWAAISMPPPSLEAEFPLGLPEEYGITGGVFFDIGSVWGLGQRPRRRRQRASAFASVGVSVLVEHADRPAALQLLEAVKKESYDKEQKLRSDHFDEILMRGRRPGWFWRCCWRRCRRERRRKVSCSNTFADRDAGPGSAAIWARFTAAPLQARY